MKNIHIVLDDKLLEKIEQVKDIENFKTLSKTIKFILAYGYEKYINQDEENEIEILKKNQAMLSRICDGQNEILLKVGELTDGNKK